jgi:hypothetical protein
MPLPACGEFDLVNMKIPAIVVSDIIEQLA